MTRHPSSRIRMESIWLAGHVVTCFIMFHGPLLEDRVRLRLPLKTPVKSRCNRFRTEATWRVLGIAFAVLVDVRLSLTNHDAGTLNLVSFWYRLFVCSCSLSKSFWLGCLTNRQNHHTPIWSQFSLTESKSWTSMHDDCSTR